MADLLYKPQGVMNTGNKGTVEYQLFPEAFFSGADVKIYLGDVWVDDILGISFALQENVKPIYSYASHTFRDVARGSRIVQGKFYIAFREAGYIHGILDHIAQLHNPVKDNTQMSAYNDLVSSMYGGDRLNFRARALQTFESLLGEYVTKAFNTNSIEAPKSLTSAEYNALTPQERLEYDGKQKKYQDELSTQDAKKQQAVNNYYTSFEREIWGRDFSSDPSQADLTYFYRSRGKFADPTQPEKGDIQQFLKKTGFDIYITYGPMAEALTTGYDDYGRVLDKRLPGENTPNKGFSFNTTVKAIRGIQLVSTAQDILPDGTVVEVYDFMARDLDA